MRNLLFILVAIAVIEAVAWWWMNPAPAGLGQPVLTWSSSDTTLADRPDLYAQSAPGLRCATGQIRSADRPDGVAVFTGFFAWESTSSTGDVLEAFRHQPEECLGYVGMKLVSTQPLRTFKVSGETLTFEHTILRSPQAMQGNVHAFKAVWLSGITTGTSREGILGGNQSSLRAVRWRAALSRFRPAHARVVQGAVQGVSSPDQAWEIFRSSILEDLEMK
ncbi:MAG: hypothetical protein ACKO2G_11855 [Verrucomicrobiales bacterium]